MLINRGVHNRGWRLGSRCLLEEGSCAASARWRRWSVGARIDGGLSSTGVRLDTLKSAAEGVGGLEALAGIFGESHDDNLIERLRDAGAENDGGLGALLEMRGHHGVVAVGLEGKLAGDHFVEGDAEGVEVGAVVGRVTLHLFGRHVIEGAESGAGHS